MKFITFIFIFFSLNVNIFGDCLTQEFERFNENTFWSGKTAKEFDPIQNPKTEFDQITVERNWTLIDSFSLKEYIPATFPNGYYFDVYFNRNTESLSTFSTDITYLTDLAKQAIQKAPNWMRHPLNLRFKSIPIDKQDLWAEVILDASYPYIDEIAFAIATLSPAYLRSNLANPEVLIMNAVYIYLNDIYLDYADVIDYGSSTTDENYYSTVVYWKLNEDGEMEQVEIPKEIYYMYIAHPKITDEIPAFIDPTILEYNHQGNIVEPGEGYFWHDYIFNHTFNDTLNLREMMAGCEYVWDGIGCDCPGGEWFAQPISPYGDSLDYALHRMSKWINADMEFTSPGDRPHQPVRIAYKGMGRCGEYADLNAAVGRSLLIPTTSISNWINIWDHTFSEMWLEDWEHYESYYWEWGATFYGSYDSNAISPFEVRSDGLLTTVTHHYVDYSTINLSILDENDQPVDGGKVKLYVQRPDEEILQSMVAYTDNNGLVTFTVSDGFDYFARAETWIGNAPSIGTALLVSSPEPGETCNLALNVSNSMPEPDLVSVDPPANEIDDFKIVVEFDVPQYAIKGVIEHDDIDGLVYDKSYAKIIDTGFIDFFVTDEFNSNMFLAEQQFETIYSNQNINSDAYEFELPETDNWHFIFSNRLHIQNPQMVNGSVKLYQYSTSAEDENIESTETFIRNYPNPFNSTTTISFQLNTEITENTEIAIYNIKGQKVKTYKNLQIDKSSDQQIVWDGKDDNNRDQNSGIYFCKISSSGKEISQKMILMR
ncbi:MAG TPA: T9SS type A sorting domain-containing protein [Candidatus Cloacimonetes bacterium]|nr:T9SS type A sorting domain-containing protein [Candidatus Cloacimonadota bacterium]